MTRLSRALTLARRVRVAGFALLALAAGATAQTYPSKPVRIVVPYAAGGAVDIVARALGQELGKRFGQNVLIENRVGAGSNIATDHVAKSAPDGYTLLMASPANAINATLYAKLPFNPATDLTPIGLVGSAPTILVCNPSLPAKNANDLVVLAKSKPGALTFGSGGSGTTEQLAGEMFKAAAKIDMVHVPYKGGAAALTDVIGGQIAVMFINQLGALPQAKAGKVRVLGVASAERSAALPSVPTFAEQGFPDMKVEVWWGVMGPGAMPKELVTRINADIAAAVASPEMKERLESLSARPIGGNSERFAAFFREEMSRWAKVVRASGAHAD